MPNFLKIVQWEPSYSRRTNRWTNRQDKANISSLFAILRRRLKCLTSVHAVHLHITMILIKIFHNFHKHHQRLFQYNHCFDKRLNPNLERSAANRHVGLHVKCLLCLKSFSTKWHVSTNFSKIPNIKFCDQIFVGLGIFHAYTLAVGRMK